MVRADRIAHRDRQPKSHENQMNAELHYILAQQRIADQQRVAQRARLARDAASGRRNSPDSTPITRLSAQLARLTARLAPTGLREANGAARTPLAHDPVDATSTATETSHADVL